MSKKTLVIFLIIGIIYIGASALGALVSNDKVVRSTAIETIKIGASGAPIPKKTTPRPAATTRPKVTATPRATAKTRTTTPAKATVKPTTKATTKPVSSGTIKQSPKPSGTIATAKTTPARKTNYSYSVTIGGSSASSITIAQGGGVMVSVKESGIEIGFDIIIGEPGLLYTSGKSIRAKYDRNITTQRRETITIRYTNKNSNQSIDVRKTIIINPHTTHSYGSWTSGPSNGTQIRTCTICGYVDSKIPFSVTIFPITCSLLIGRTQTITINAMGYGEGTLTKKFSSSDTSIATVTSGGRITAKKHGLATITVRVGIQGTTEYKTLDCVVHVHGGIREEFVWISEEYHRVIRRCEICNEILEEKIEGHDEINPDRGGDGNTCRCGQSLVPECSHEEGSGIICSFNFSMGEYRPSREGHYILYYCAKCTDYLMRREFVSHTTGTGGNISSNNEIHYCSACNWEEAHSGSVRYTTTASCEVPGNVYRVLTCDFCSQNVSNKVGELLGLNHVYSSDAETNIPFNLSDGTSVTIVFPQKTPSSDYIFEDGILLTDESGRPSRFGTKYQHNVNNSNDPKHWYYKWCYRCGDKVLTESPCTLTYSFSHVGTDNKGYHVVRCFCGRVTTKDCATDSRYITVLGERQSYPFTINGRTFTLQSQFSHRQLNGSQNYSLNDKNKSGITPGTHTTVRQCNKCGGYTTSNDSHTWVASDVSHEPGWFLIFPTGEHHKYRYRCSACYYDTGMKDEKCRFNGRRWCDDFGNWWDDCAGECGSTYCRPTYDNYIY